MNMQNLRENWGQNKTPRLANDRNIADILEIYKF